MFQIQVHLFVSVSFDQCDSIDNNHRKNSEGHDKIVTDVVDQFAAQGWLESPNV